MDGTVLQKRWGGSVYAKRIAHNVPAVCDGFAVAIKEHEVFQQPQNCGGAKRHKGRKPDWRFAEPEPP